MPTDRLVDNKNNIEIREGSYIATAACGRTQPVDAVAIERLVRVRKQPPTCYDYRIIDGLHLTYSVEKLCFGGR
jgi:hypothetical protein